MSDSKIIQILLTEENSKWQGRLLGLADDGFTYAVNNDGLWEKFIPPVGTKKGVE